VHTGIARYNRGMIRFPSRRDVLAASTAAFLAPLLARAAEGKVKHVLLRSSWQTVNIGDIAHTPGMLRLLQIHLPDAPVTLWPSSVDNGVDEMLLKNFPKLKIAKGSIDKEGKPTTEALRAAFAECDFLLHGSGPSVVAANHLEAWHMATGKPFGIYGVTLGVVDEKLRDLIAKAAFLFCRDTDSLAYFQSLPGAKPPVMEFAPDAAFAVNLRDDEHAAAFLKSTGLEERKFLCAIPRLRWTPYPRLTLEQKKERFPVNEKFKEVDHAKMRQAIIAWVRKTGHKVLVCPEMTYQVELLAPLLVDPLPDDVRKNVVRRENYWITDEAVSVYAKARAVVSFEMHSPILALASGTPAIHLRQPTDTRKGQMWRDIGLGDWLFEIDQSTGDQIAAAVVALGADYAATRAKAAKAMEYVRHRQKATMDVVAGAL
jgi:polysaccharide pyruvyl transferase WcaK-like protein